MPNRDGTGPTGKRVRSRRGPGRGAGLGSNECLGGRSRGRGQGRAAGSNQGASWINDQIDGLQAAIHRFTTRLIALNQSQRVIGENMTRLPRLSQFLTKGLRQS